MHVNRPYRLGSALFASALIVAACANGSDPTANSNGSGPPATSDAAIRSVDSVGPPDTATIGSTIEPAPTSTDIVLNSTEVVTTIEPPGTRPDRESGDLSSLVWATVSPSSFAGLDPAEAFGSGSYALLAQIVEHLVSVDGGLEPVPSLAASWSSNDTATVWTFELRSGVTFHDGSTFDADDVVYSLERMLDRAFTISESLEGSNIVAVDADTVEITLRTGAFDLPAQLSDLTPHSAILPEGYEPDQNLIGTGPFVLTEYDEVGGARMSANSEWWAGSAAVDDLTFIFIDDSARTIASLRSGEADGAAFINPADASMLLNDDTITLARTPSINHRQIWMRTDEGPFSDVRVRQAFALAIDRQELVDSLFEGEFARIANDYPIDSRVMGYDDTVPQRSKDDDAARALLTEAGFPDGVSAVLNTGDLAEIPDLGELIASQAASAGFDITVNVQDNATFYSDAWCPFSDVPAGEVSNCFDNEPFGIVDYGFQATTAAFLNRPLVSDGVWNASNFDDATYDALFAAYDTAASPEAAADQIGGIQNYIHEQVPFVIPYFIDTLSAHSSDIVVSTTELGQPRLATASLAE